MVCVSTRSRCPRIDILPAMTVAVSVDSEMVSIVVTGWDRLWSFSSGRSIRIDEISSVEVMSQREVKRRLLIRIGGAYLPGVMATGHFLMRRDHTGRRCRAWLAMYRDRDVLVLMLRERQPRMVAIQHRDADRLAAEIDRHLPR